MDLSKRKICSYVTSGNELHISSEKNLQNIGKSFKKYIYIREPFKFFKIENWTKF